MEIHPQLKRNEAAHGGNLEAVYTLKDLRSLDAEWDVATVLDGLGVWMRENGEAIYGTRPWQLYGEGSSGGSAEGHFGEGSISYGPEDIRFTVKDGALYAIVLGMPEGGVVVRSLASGEHAVRSVSLLGAEVELAFEQDAEGLRVTLPERIPESVAAIHETMDSLHQVGAINKKTMRDFDAACLEPATELQPGEIRNLRIREHVSQPIFAVYLNVSKNLISDWERGIKKPGGPALRLLNIVQKHGLEALV